MAANANSFIRVRLHFDYAPPAVIGCRMCWLLVDLRSCRVVADLEGIIKEKFELSRGSILSLFIEDCYLPHTESILVVRDNDCVRVKVDTVSKDNHHTSPEAPSRKRQRTAENGDNGSGESGINLEFKKKKRKKSAVESPQVNGLQTEVEDSSKKSPKKLKDKKKKRKDEDKQKSAPPTPPKPSPSVRKMANSVGKVVKNTKMPQNSSSSDTSSSSAEEQPVKKCTKLATKTPTATNPAAPKPITNGRPASKKLPPPTSSSSSDSDSSLEEDTAKSAKTFSTSDKSRSRQVISTNSISTASVDKSKSEQVISTNFVPTASADIWNSEEEIELVIKKPIQQPHGKIVVGQPSWQQSGRGRGKGKQSQSREWSKGRGNCIQNNYNEEREPSYSTDSLTNVSVVIQNREESAPKTKPDYNSMPMLAAPPQVGQKIAFKLLELTENFTPEVSDYKEAKILSFDPASKQIELELLSYFQAPVEPGKFDLVYQNPDGSERVEYAVDRGSLVTERWNSLLEPRLII